MKISLYICCLWVGFIQIPIVIAQNTLTVRPVVTDELLVNPGMGFTTFQMFNGDNLKAKVDVLGDPSIERHSQPEKDFRNNGYPQTSIAYFRVLWSFIEPNEGEYRFGYIDSLLKIANQRDQTLMLRISPYKGKPGTDVPDWYRAYVGDQRDFSHQKWVVDPEDPRYAHYFGNMIKALGDRYDGHPDLESVDVSIVGWAGEGGGTELLSDNTMKKLLDAYTESFRNTTLTVLIHGEKANEYITSKRHVGWRQDCLGDLDFWADEQDGWTHMYDYYPQTIINYNMQDAWKTAPVSFESCAEMMSWKNHHKYTEKEVNYIIEQSLKWHISSFNNKSAKIPEEWWPLIEEWQKKMGYRLVLRKFTYPENLKSGQKLTFTSWWENNGVAPCYKKYPLAIRLRNAQHSEVLLTDADITGWLPGDNLYDNAVFVPMDMPAGEYDLQIGIVDPRTSNTKIKLPIEGRTNDGWYSLGKLNIL